jgi:hypothetical protein
MINLILSFLRLRSLITLGIAYSLFSAATHSHFSLKVPSFSDASMENLNKAIMNILNGNSSDKSSSKKKTDKIDTAQDVVSTVEHLLNQKTSKK